MKHIKTINQEFDNINEGRVAAKKLLQMVVKGNSSDVEGINLSKEMATAYLEWLQYSTFGKKYGELPFDKLFAASFNWGIERYVKGKELQRELAILKQWKKDNIKESITEGTKTGGKLNKNKKYKSKEYGEVVFMGYRNDMKTMMLKSKEKGMIRTSIHNEKTMVPIDESMNEGFSEWEMSFAPMVLSGVKLDPKTVYKVKARSTVEAIKKASKEAGLSGNDWMATVTNKLEKIK